MSVRRLLLLFLLVGSLLAVLLPATATSRPRCAGSRTPLMHSPGHRRNILYRRATHFGVSTWIAGRVIWVTVNFKQVPPG
jgi:hypothetical protein